MSRPLPRLLYIDDDEGLCHVVKRDLERNGYTVDIALDGRYLGAAVEGGWYLAWAHWPSLYAN